MTRPAALLVHAFLKLKQAGHPQFPLIMAVLNQLLVIHCLNCVMLIEQLRHFKLFHFIFLGNVMHMLLTQ